MKPSTFGFWVGGFQAFLRITAAHPLKCDHLLHNVSVARVRLAYTIIHVCTRALLLCCPVIMELFIGLGHMIHPPNHKHFISYSEKTAGAAFALIGHSYCFS